MRRLVDEGAFVVALVRDPDPQSELIRSGDAQRVSVVSGSLADYAAIERAVNHHEIDTVFHLGAQTIVGTADRNPLETFESNIRGTYNLLEACRVHSNLVQRILVASSDKAYGESETLPYTEDLPPLGRAPYEVSKSCTDLISRCYAQTYGMPVVVARCGNIYGGGDLNWSRLIPGTIASILRGDTPVVRSDGLFKRDYVFVEDAVEAYMTMAGHATQERIRGEAFNFGPNHPLTVLDVIKLVGNLMDQGDIAPIILNQAVGEIRDQYLDSSKAKRLLGWSAKHSVEEGLKKTIEWYRDYLNTPTGR